jgi:hypothetical protein
MQANSELGNNGHAVNSREGLPSERGRGLMGCVLVVIADRPGAFWLKVGCSISEYQKLQLAAPILLRLAFHRWRFRIFMSALAGAPLYFLDRLPSMNFCKGLNDLSVR